MTDDAAWPLAQHVCRTGYADLPASAVESARRDILDTFGCMLGGSGSPGIVELFAVIARWGGREESRVLLRDTRLPAPQAALLNASMGHALDFDDTLDTGGSIHPGVSVLGSALAVCDSLGAISGRDVLLAVALGLDVSCRIALACTLDRGWHRTAAIGVFGATAAAGKLIGLTPKEMLAAFGIAYSHAAGNRQCILDGALTKRMQAGQAASAGVFSAVLAQTGFSGARNIFNGRFGFLELYQPNGYDASVLLRDLGTAFRGEMLSYKPYPCGRPLHAAIDAALAARAQLKIERPEDIASVTIEADPAGHAANKKTERVDRRTAEAQTGTRQVVVVAREVMGRTLPFIVPRESDAVPMIRQHVASGTVIHADESTAWERLHASYDTRRVNHSQEYVTEDGVNVNQAESYFSRLRRAEYGIHHRISGQYLYQYANEMAWREDRRREPNGLHWRRVTGAALRHPKSEIWTGYWQRAAA